MLGRTNNQRYLLGLALGTAVMALAMASLLVFELAQKRAIDQSSVLRSDSLTALAFQFEREFLRTRQELAITLALAHEPDRDGLTLRYDIFLSRLALLRESPSVALLTPREEYKKVIPRLMPLVAEMDQALAAKTLERKALSHILAEFNAMGADVQAMTLAANSEVVRLLERQVDTMREQNALIVGLTVAQLVLLLVASAALVVRQRRMEAERLALEKMADALREAHVRAEAANRGKSQFLANMSHELRTPFNGLMGMLGLMQSTPMTPQQSDYIHTAQSSAKHLLTLLNDILDISALDDGKMVLKPTVVDLSQLLDEVGSLMQPLAKSKALDFQIIRPTQALPLVFADETRIKQIVFNLVSNAIKFTQRGEVVLSVTTSPGNAERLDVAFEVRDTGIGLDELALSRLFQRFYQVDDSSTRRFGGTGLGLEISQTLARMMDGAISVSSKVGVGSSFTALLRLPTSAGMALDAEAAEHTTARSAPTGAEVPVQAMLSEPVPETLSGSSGSRALRVLAVDDHPVNQKLLTVLLGRMGCQVSNCEDGQLALELVQQQSFDLILMDVNMPVMDGLTATRHIRALAGPAAQTPIVVLTADVMNQAYEQALLAGANDFISKPINVEQLRGIVRKYASEASRLLS